MCTVKQTTKYGPRLASSGGNTTNRHYDCGAVTNKGVRILPAAPRYATWVVSDSRNNTTVNIFLS